MTSPSSSAYARLHSTPKPTRPQFTPVPPQSAAYSPERQRPQLQQQQHQDGQLATTPSSQSATSTRRASTALHAIMDGTVPAYLVVEEAWDRSRMSASQLFAQGRLDQDWSSLALIGTASTPSAAAVSAAAAGATSSVSASASGGGGGGGDSHLASPATDSLHPSPHAQQQQHGSRTPATSRQQQQQPSPPSGAAAATPRAPQFSAAATVTTVRTTAELEDIEAFTRAQHEPALLQMLDQRHEHARDFLRRNLNWTSGSASIQRAEALLRAQIRSAQAAAWPKIERMARPLQIAATATAPAPTDTDIVATLAMPQQRHLAAETVLTKGQLFAIEARERDVLVRQVDLLWPRLGVATAEMYHRAELDRAAFLLGRAHALEFDALFRTAQRILTTWSALALERLRRDQRDFAAGIERRYRFAIELFHQECREGIERARVLAAAEARERREAIDEPAALLCALQAAKRREYKSIGWMPWRVFCERWDVSHAGEIPGRAAIEAEERAIAAETLIFESEALHRAAIADSRTRVFKTEIASFFVSLTSEVNGAIFEDFAALCVRDESAFGEMNETVKSAIAEAHTRCDARNASAQGHLRPFFEFERERRDAIEFYHRMVANSLAWFFHDVAAFERRGFFPQGSKGGGGGGGGTLVTSDRNGNGNGNGNVSSTLWRELEPKRKAVHFFEESDMKELSCVFFPIQEQIHLLLQHSAEHERHLSKWTVELEFIKSANTILVEEAEKRRALVKWTSQPATASMDKFVVDTMHAMGDNDVRAAWCAMMVSFC